ncbi:MFS transporter [Streptomyces capoamus]|uniref:MFS transporter n=1 Tax=Streptomyces capoamus TaxID=68183 RepID=A0A919F391_9ACTN|nr:MFS transporter [Streptomyces capoamus]GGP32504.1 MFS transporter [Streptomyces libani subsp. rufus]GHG75663.1 MFS transporter [Streptomyces capoamus]
MPLALLALAMGAFGIGTTEFVATGILPQVADTYGVSIPAAGYLVTAYAVGVVVGAPVMTLLGTRMSRKSMLALLMAVFVAGNALCAAAPSFALLLLGRVLASFAHGAFFGIGSVVAADLVAPHRRASAISMMFSGLTIANVAGVPLGTLVGQAAGWRVTFVLIALLGVLGVAGVLRFVPADRRPERVGVAGEAAALRNPQVVLAMLMTVLGFGGVFAAVTYIAPILTEVASFPDSSVSGILVVFGCGLVLGNIVGGRLADKRLMPMLCTSLALLGATLLCFSLTASHQAAAVILTFLIGVFGFATVPPLQKRVLDNAAGAPTLASSLNIGAFNLGNAIAAWLGGLTISAGFGYASSSAVGAVMTAAALLTAVASGRLERRQHRTASHPNPVPAPAPTEGALDRTP